MAQSKVDSLSPSFFRLTNIVRLMLSLCFLFETAVLAQTPKNVRETEKLVEQLVRAGEDVDLKQQKIGADFLVKVLGDYKPPANKPSRGIHIANAQISDKLYAENMVVPYLLVLENCTFNEDIDFTGSSFQKGLSLRGSTFSGRAIFYQVSVEGGLRVNKAQFQKEANFDSIKVGGKLELYQSKFYGPFIISNSEMNALECADDDQALGHAEFRSDADFYGISVKGDANFTHSSFAGSVNFSSSDIGKNLEMTNVQFTDPRQVADFFGMRVGNNAFFNESKFLGGFNLNEAEITGRLEFSKTQATNTNATKTFSGMKVGTLRFKDASLLSPYDLDGAEYNRLDVDSGGNDTSLALIEESTYSRDTYTYLEAYYRRVGLENTADDVYIEAKKQERSRLLQQGFGNLPEYLGSWLFYIAAGYGKHKELALVWGIGFIVLGYAVFRQEKYMLVQNANDQKRYEGQYRPLWYSIALFLPIVDLEDSKIWAPQLDRKKSRFYMRLHTILGYLLIPIGLAAWTGLIK